jgi:hypothetical protein
MGAFPMLRTLCSLANCAAGICTQVRVGRDRELSKVLVRANGDETERSLYLAGLYS